MGTATLCHYQNMQPATPSSALKNIESFYIFNSNTYSISKTLSSNHSYALVYLSFGGGHKATGNSKMYIPNAGGCRLLKSGDSGLEIGCGYWTYAGDQYNSSGWDSGDSGRPNYTIRFMKSIASFTGTEITVNISKESGTLFVVTLSGFAFNM